jgi:hypothetical protein
VGQDGSVYGFDGHLLVTPVNAGTEASVPSDGQARRIQTWQLASIKPFWSISPCSVASLAFTSFAYEIIEYFS